VLIVTSLLVGIGVGFILGGFTAQKVIKAALQDMEKNGEIEVKK